MAGIKLSALIDAIAGLSVTLSTSATLKILKDSTIPENVTRLGAVMYPKPNGFITDLSAVPVSYGSNGGEKIDVSYTLTYVFCDIPIGSNRTLGDNYTVLVDDTVLILNKLITNDNVTGGVDLRVSGLPSFGVVYDPSGAAYYGTEIQLAVQELYEV